MGSDRLSPEPMSQTPQTLPLLFTFSQLVAGNGFVAGVRMAGKALVEDEDDEFWVTGVAPVGIAASGATRDAALAEFRKAWTSVLFDLAAQAQSFAEFKTASEAFLDSSESRISDLWAAAVAVIRNSGYQDPELQRGNANDQPRFEVVEIVQPAADANEFDPNPLLAA